MIKSLFFAVTIVFGPQGYYKSLSNHIKRWLKEERIESQVVRQADLPHVLPGEKILFLVGVETFSQAEIKSIRDFFSRGGKAAVFHSSNRELASLMGVRCLGFAKASYPGQWSRMDFISSRAAGFPLFIRQTSSVLNKAEPLPGSKVLATWTDRNGRPSDDAAWIESKSGWWMTHVLTADGDERLKMQLVSAMVGVSDPSKWSASESFTRREKERKSLVEYASRQRTVRGELHAVWDHSGCGLYPGDWPRTINVLKNAGVTDIFVNIAGAGFAHYNSSVLPKSQVFTCEGDQLLKCLRAAKGSGIRVHAWILCFTATRSSRQVIERFKTKSWCLKTRNGAYSDYLDPSVPAVREYVLSAIKEIQHKYPVDGVHLDFVRWYELSAKPRNSASVISDFVLKARRAVKRPKWLTAAVLGKYPQCVESVGQDWRSWLDMNIVDYAVPMDYTENLTRFESYLAQHSQKRSHASRIIAGIGVTANESRLNARQVIDQAKLARKYKLAGVALFDLDMVLEKEILPYLSVGMW